MADKAEFVDTISDATRQRWRRPEKRITEPTVVEERSRLSHWPPASIVDGTPANNSVTLTNPLAGAANVAVTLTHAPSTLQLESESYPLDWSGELRVVAQPLARRATAEGDGN